MQGILAIDEFSKCRGVEIDVVMVSTEFKLTEYYQECHISQCYNYNDLLNDNHNQNGDWNGWITFVYRWVSYSF